MKTTKEKKISLVKYSIYSIGVYTAILLEQIYIMIKNVLPSKPIFIGPIYLPLLVSSLLLLLLLVAWVLKMKQSRNTEVSDELADLNKYKAGYITKYISVFVLPLILLLVKEFNLLPEEDIVGNILSVFLVALCITELIHHIVFIILEKK